MILNLSVFKLLFCFFVFCVSVTLACTSFAIEPFATKNNAAFVTYNADDHDQYGHLKFFPRAKHQPGTFRKIYDGDTGVYLGQIPEAAETFNVVHFANDWGLAIGESTFGGLDILSTPYPGSIMDYGSLMTVALQRARNSREAIKLMGSLVEQYGYASTGESFSIADEDEAWIMEMIGKGKYGKGAVWVAMRVPFGYMVAHANQARITQFPKNDNTTCIYSKDVVSFARTIGYKGTDDDFSFSDFYAPVTPELARVCEARVWSVYQRVTGGKMGMYLDYVRGWNITNRMPLFVKPVNKLDRYSVFELMRDHYQENFFAFNKTDTDIGAGAYYLPYRPRPLFFNVHGKKYANERAIATQQTLSTQVVEIRPSAYFSDPSVATIVWFGVDDTLHNVRIPLYTGIKRIPKQYAVGVADATTFSFESAFWVFNMVANLAYTSQKYIGPEIETEIEKWNQKFEKSLKVTDENIGKQWEMGDYQGALMTATDYCVDNGEALVPAWLNLWQRLFVKYMDFDIRTKVPGKTQPSVGNQAPPQSWYNKIVSGTGDHYFIPSGNVVGNRNKVMNKNLRRNTYPRGL